MVKSTHIAFPQAGVELHVSAQDALAHGINPGDPAVVEVTLRAHTVEEWIVQAGEVAAPTPEDETSPTSGLEPTARAAEGGTDEDPARIRWRSAEVPTPARPEAEVTDPTEPEVADPTRIRWKSAAEPKAAAPSGYAAPSSDAAASGLRGFGEDHATIRWRSAA